MRNSVIVALLPLVWVVGCAHAPTTSERNPQTLLKMACEPGSGVAGVQGNVWMKAKSKEASGQFPASVQAKPPGTVRLEVTNLLGGTEAIIDADENQFKVEAPDKKTGSLKTVEAGSGTWGGIPLHWAGDLFLGKIPCPSAAALKDAHLDVTNEGVLEIATVAALDKEEENFEYTFRSWGGKPWPEALRWERKGSVPLTVEFHFDDPDDASGSPRKWEAKSARGEVKVRWKDRELQH